MDHIPIEDKPYYRIGEVARLLEVPTHVLRYWESEFPQLRPVRAPSGHRLYHRQHIELAVRIKTMLHHEGLTIAGARRRLEGEGEPAPPTKPAPAGQLAAELRDILKLIKD